VPLVGCLKAAPTWQTYFNNVPVPTTVNNRVDHGNDRRGAAVHASRYQVVVRNLGLADPANPKLGDGVSNRAWLIVGYR
jgi:hypothetical protein